MDTTIVEVNTTTDIAITIETIIEDEDIDSI